VVVLQLLVNNHACFELLRDICNDVIEASIK
jgi:hypothetical protein